MEKVCPFYEKHIRHLPYHTSLLFTNNRWISFETFQMILGCLTAYLLIPSTLNSTFSYFGSIFVFTTALLSTSFLAGICQNDVNHLKFHEIFKNMMKHNFDKQVRTNAF